MMVEAGQRHIGTRALLERLTAGAPDDILQLGNILDGLGRRAFGVLLFLAIPPAFFPGVAAVLGAPVVVLIGLQLLLARPYVWLPRRIAERGPKRQVLMRFKQRFDRWLGRIERLVKPRWPLLIDHTAARMFTGLLLVLLGILLALPIPFTNALFAGLLLLFALALLERDGRLLLVAWLTGVAAIGSLSALSGGLASLAGNLFS